MITAYKLMIFLLPGIFTGFGKCIIKIPTLIIIILTEPIQVQNIYTITNPADFANFTSTYPELTYFSMETHGWNTLESIGIDFKNCYEYFFDILGKSDEESMELATALVIGKYNTGIGVSKKDNSGNFQPIFVKELPGPSDPSKKIYQLTNECNLK